jgi:four helix bundle protein
METTDWNAIEKPFDIRHRLFLFACLIVRLVQYLHSRGPIAAALSTQVLKSGTSAGANYEEADSGSSDRDKLAKRKIVLRELKETRFRLRVLRHTGYLGREHDAIIQESTELANIVAALIRKSEASAREHPGR